VIEIFTPKPTEENRFPIQRIRVWPASEDIRKYIVHPLGHIKFRATLKDSVEWPFDQFTKRRLRKGDVLDHPPADPPEQSELDLEKN
jgi:hypothetical protein